MGWVGGHWQGAQHSQCCWGWGCGKWLECERPPMAGARQMTWAGLCSGVVGSHRRVQREGVATRQAWESELSGAQRGGDTLSRGSQGSMGWGQGEVPKVGVRGGQVWGGPQHCCPDWTKSTRGEAGHRRLPADPERGREEAVRAALPSPGSRSKDPELRGLSFPILASQHFCLHLLYSWQGFASLCPLLPRSLGGRPFPSASPAPDTPQSTDSPPIDIPPRDQC